ncbi:c-type cytochrome biogenesis protein CcmI [Photobacterium indicum]|jgi:cytochrome c-type biogenesis protein CcmI|uniref:C-type cytochrome biogenesis protein CcmI n=1 Tax=Photobacterium indicum TaxID=81447 RepID=A0A2T3LBH8_9GAMM|nr:c-type cytochrome biogenesis protein CcmI [Photobacterium indicum]PSV48690.1 c-type cytochrome biogenesis protein CcmI [Photobacterium indicum]
MTLFWIVTVILVLIAGAIFVIPMYKGKEQDDVASRDELNKAFFKDRISELEEENSEGLVVNQDELVSELQQSLLDDVPMQAKQQAVGISPLMVLPGLILLVGICYGMYLSVGSLNKVEAWQETVSRLPDLSKRLMDDQNAEPLSDQEMDDLTLALRTRLHDNPNDATGWLLLGRIGMANRDAETSQGAMIRAYKLDPSNPDIQLGYAQTLMLIGDPNQGDFARQILRSVVQRDPSNTRALSLLAFDAFERNEYQQAVSYWTMMKNIIGDNDPRANMLTRSIERAQARIDKVNAVDVSADSVTVNVALDPAVSLPAQGFLILSVHSADGAPMPIAARRIPLSSQFPVTVTLDDNDSMIPERKMSSLSEMIVKARIDSDGNVMTKQGDWYGQSDVLSLGASTIVTINKQYQ